MAVDCHSVDTVNIHDNTDVTSPVPSGTVFNILSGHTITADGGVECVVKYSVKYIPPGGVETTSDTGCQASFQTHGWPSAWSGTFTLDTAGTWDIWVEVESYELSDDSGDCDAGIAPAITTESTHISAVVYGCKEVDEVTLVSADPVSGSKLALGETATITFQYSVLDDGGLDCDQSLTVTKATGTANLTPAPTSACVDPDTSQAFVVSFSDSGAIRLNGAVNFSPDGCGGTVTETHLTPTISYTYDVKWEEEDTPNTSWAEENTPDDSWSEENTPNSSWSEENTPNSSWSEENTPDSTWTEE